MSQTIELYFDGSIFPQIIFLNRFPMTIFLTDLILDTLLTIYRIPDTTSATEVVMLISLSPTCKNTFVGQNLVASSKHGLCINDFVVVPF